MLGQCDKKYIFNLMFVFFTIGIAGCASITGSRNQPVTVTTTYKGQPITGAHCTLQNDKGMWTVSTPGSVTIQKAYGDLSLTCRKDPTHVGSNTFKSSHEGSVWGNVLVGGLIGYAVDSSSGAGFSYPQTMNVDMVTQHAHG
jgi:hypothetical protein